MNEATISATARTMSPPGTPWPAPGIACYEPGFHANLLKGGVNLFAVPDRYERILVAGDQEGRGVASQDGKQRRHRCGHVLGDVEARKVLVLFFMVGVPPRHGSQVGGSHPGTHRLHAILARGTGSSATSLPASDVVPSLSERCPPAVMPNAPSRSRSTCNSSAWCRTCRTTRRSP